MKKNIIIILLLTVSTLSYSQSWKYKTFNSDFDGSYKLARVYGTGGEFPYKNPDLVVIRYSTGSVNIYIYLMLAILVVTIKMCLLNLIMMKKYTQQVR